MNPNRHRKRARRRYMQAVVHVGLEQGVRGIHVRRMRRGEALKLKQRWLDAWPEFERYAKHIGQRVS